MRLWAFNTSKGYKMCRNLSTWFYSRVWGIKNKGNYIVSFIFGDIYGLSHLWSMIYKKRSWSQIKCVVFFYGISSPARKHTIIYNNLEDPRQDYLDSGMLLFYYSITQWFDMKFDLGQLIQHSKVTLGFALECWTNYPNLGDFIALNDLIWSLILGN